ncbi:OsmC family protein [Ramlibacter alkalitolerans]|jgi:organic hydroperoxide reductase OsmC/OhrA|uniref:OsmC family protein n=1 Tax=Ramlibacter alkalitolerans TaxID=2039631 RepID=A0ABS1JIM2_9BURK|nr:OsmC family protein [Ramlibacter alkalitolerans]MBL0424073.1 OsmC family protein [Ramlibacter alkalitolerans]
MIEAFPHHYRAHGAGTPEGAVRVEAAGLPAIETLPPPQFGGPEGYWSPESLLLSAVADCYVLSFRSVAHASRLQWIDLQVDVDGVLDRVDGIVRFTHLTLSACLTAAEGSSATLALTVLKKAKSLCLVSNSLIAESVLVPDVRIGGEAGPR